MEMLAIMKLIPIVMSVVEVGKRFIPKKKRKVVNPMLAVITGLVGAYMAGGTEEILSMLMVGVTAAVGAIASYKIPKEISRKIGIEPK
jgi:drug/metabolite transporter (DMT)-like permease